MNTPSRFRCAGCLFGMLVFLLTLTLAQADNWRPAGPNSDGRPMYGTWFASPTEGWAVGTDGGAIRHTIDGGLTWSDQPTGLSGSTTIFYAIWGTDASNVWAVGSGSTILRYNGTSWALQGLSFTPTANNHLWGVWGADANNVWAVGGDSFVGSGTIFKWNGSTWTAQTSGTTQVLQGVWGTGTTNAWAVGFSGTILRWNGSAWSPETSGTSATLNGITGVDASNVWAVGNGGVIRKWDGSSWTAQTSGTSAALRHLWAADANNVWVTTGGNDVLKWDGSSWSSQATGAVNSLLSISGGNASSVYAVGEHGNIVKWNGSAWSTLATGPPGTLAGIWGANANNIWAVGANVGFASTIVKWDGASWTSQTHPNVFRLRGVWGADASNVWAVGDAGAILRWDGSTWSTQTSGTTRNLYAIWGADANNVWAVGQFNTVLKWNGSSWSVHDPTAGVDLYAVWGTSANNVWAVGYAPTSSGIIRHWDGSSWSYFTGPPSGDLTAIWGTSNSNFWIGGNNGKRYRWDGSTWVNHSTVVSDWFTGLWGDGTGNVWAVGLYGRIDKWNGLSWSTETLNTTEHCTGVWGMNGSLVYSSMSNQIRTNAPFAPAVTTQAATSITPAGVTLNGTVNPGGGVTSAQFDYGPTAAFGQSATITLSPNNGTTTQNVSTTVSGLAPGTLYVFRASATNAFGTALGSNQVFTTPDAPDIAVEQPAGSGLQDGVSSVGYGDVLTGSSLVKTFTIRNTGNQTLNSIAVTKDGANAGDFTLGSPGVTTLAPGASTTLDVTFNASTTGARTANLHITSDDPDESPFDLVLTATTTAREIAVEQPAATNLTDGSSTVAYGNVMVGASLVKTFTVRNVGTSVLTLTGVTKDGTNQAEFTVGSLSGTSVAPGATVTFNVTFIPTALGARTAAIHIGSDDADENPFDIALTGNGTGPEITVEQPSLNNVPDGGTVAYGSTNLGTPVVKTFTVKNSGNSNLTLTGVTKDGTDAADFTIGSLGSTVIAPASVTTFNVTFNPSVLGAKTAAIHIGSDDSDENPFDITLTGTGTAPEIAVEQPAGTDLTDGSSTIDYGTLTVGSPSVKTFTVRNTGNSTLTLSAITKDGTNASEFTVGSLSSSSIAPAATATFTVTFTPASIGAKTAAIHLPSNDANENPFDIALTGIGTGPEIAVEQPAGTNLTDGSSTIAYGSTTMGTPVVKTFTIRNLGDQDLTGLAVTKDGSNPGDFTIGSLGATTLAAGASTTFDVTFNTFSPTARSAAIHIASNDANENPFDLNLTGTGTGPEIGLEQPSGTNLADGTSTVAWGGVVVGTSPVVKTFTIRNNGTTLLSGLAVSVDGTNASEFTASAPGVNALNPGSSTTFTITFNPAANGFKTAALHVTNNDVDENPFDVALTGSGTTAPVNWRVAGANADGRPLEKVWFADANNGWSVGGNTLNYSSIRSTTDGGLNWNSQLSGFQLDLKGVWGTNTSNVWAVGMSGVIVKWNGSSWGSQSSGTGNDLYGVWGLDANNVWAVGLSGTIRKFNGSTWSAQTSGTTTVAFTSVWGADASNVWAVGTGGAIYKFNGTSWAVQTSGTTQILRSVWGTAANNVWAVGDAGTIVRWNGTSWAAQTSGTTTTLYSVTGTDANNIWAVGNTGLIRKWNGTAWSTQTSNTTQPLHGNVHPSATTGWAVGEAGAILKWNGTAWSTTSSGTGGAFPFRGMWGSDADTVWTAGDGGLIYKGNATTGWTPQTSGTTNALYGVWAADATNIWAVGATGTIRKGNGTTWAAQTSGTTNLLLAIHGLNTTNQWAVGLGGIILKGNGTTWAVQTSGTTNQLNSVHAIDANNVWAVGAAGTIRKWDGTAWGAQTSGTANALYDVWGPDANNLWAVGATGTIVKWNGTAWSVKTSGTTSDLNAIWGTDTTNLWACGLNGLLLKSNDGGESWIADVSNTTATLNALWGSGSTLYTTGNAGVIMTNIGIPPVPTTLAATSVTAYGATLNATVHPEGVVTTAKFQYGLTTSYGTDAIVTLSPNNGNAFQNVSAVLTNLASNTTYHFRISTTNSGGTVTGSDLTFTTPAIAEIAVEQPAATPLTDGSGTVGFGTTPSGTPVVKTFTIRNTGTANLTLGTITKDGTAAADFTIGAPGATTLAPAATTTFDVTFNPSSFGAKSAAIHIASNDATESPFDIALTGTGAAPEIVVEQPADTDLADGSASISFGSSAPGNPVARTFTIRNTGNANLTLTDITKDGPNQGDFVIGTPGATTIAPGDSTTFEVTFTPAATGARTAALHIASNDADENPFDIAMGGTGAAPEITVEQPAGTDLTDGSATIAFGDSLVGTPVIRTFTVKNTGISDLNGISITKDGTDAAQFAVSAPGATTLAAGANTTFTVTFTPASSGAKSAAIHIASDDADENPFDIALGGTGTAPEIAIEQPVGTGLTSGSATVSFGDVPTGTPQAKSFTVKNTGTATLTGLALTMDGADAVLFSATTIPTTLAAGGSFTFDITFTPTTTGSKTAALHLASSDADENPFNIALTGNGTVPEIAIEQPVGTGLTDGTSSVAFADTPVGGSSILTFTIRNTGTADLTGLAVTKDGTGASALTLGAPAATTLAPGATTTFTVTFSPSSGGASTAAIHIASNDTDENPFDIALTGNGTLIVSNWRTTFFGSPDNSGDGADLADPDNDGLENLLEFALGLNPTSGASQQLPQPLTAGGNLTLSFTEPTGIDGIIYGAEYTSNLSPGSWLPVADTGTGGNHIFSVPMAGNPGLFIRLVVTAE
ncbi:choice-of-anchor D domain-containing protein [Luteolibacter ambystomatis]|uniref:Choice-of-anchor D domain-containing protein n=1 Tax=Luteolibacter ambystomatis TaxID=2824561 RepID=A0A975J0Q1_9BACT|nr:choice-of-anchor D domain-containing protein [Luteolibacter ambystomatis]QUE51883.1 choice-of-anchor D domain-containing protein [Luteolibacter ambystomatis]